MAAPRRFRFRPCVELLEGLPQALGSLGSLAARLGPLLREPVLLESAPSPGASPGGGSAPDGWSADLLAFDPLPVRLPRSLAGLRRLLERLRPEGEAPPGPFRGGFLGALAHELARDLEPGLELPDDPWGWPPILGGLYTDFLVRERGGPTWLVLGEEPGDGRPPVRERLRRLRAALAREPALEPCRPLGPQRRLTSPEQHAARIASARAAIAAGEIYQANLSYRCEREVVGDPLDLYLRLCALHPATRSGFLRTRVGALLCASPELLLELRPDEAGALARTQPIKGTIARGSDPEEDRRQVQRLLASEKDRAELAMIVDLERNDLGRVARPGSVRVEGFARLRSLASVHHLVADVLARPREGRDAVDCLRSLFPGGSVTGVPKLRSLELIAALEGEGRGHAYGSLLYLDTRGRCEANLLIRTLLWRPREGGRGQGGAGQVSYRVGGGITWGSRPEEEEEETRVKGLLLARALEGPPSGAPAHGAPPPGVEALR